MVKIIDRRNQAIGGQTNDRSKNAITRVGVHWDASNGTIEAHERYWRNSKGWTNGGYHFFVDKLGVIYWNYNLTKTTNGVGDHNSDSVHVCYAGNHANPMNDKQKEAIKYVINKLFLPELPNVKQILGHNEFPNTSRYNHKSNSCPGTDMNKFRAFLKGETEKPTSKPVTPQAPSKPSKPAPSKSQWTKVNGSWTGQTLSRGQYGEPVRQLQTLLAAKHYYPNKGAKNNGVDSFFGADTLDAVRRYQSKHGLTVDGLPGKATFASLKGSSPKPAVTSKGGDIAVDGYWGVGTTRKLQQAFGTPADGVISKPSLVVRRLQALVGAQVDGYLGPETYRRLQAYLGTPVDGRVSKPSVMVKEMQRRLNAGTFL